MFQIAIDGPAGSGKSTIANLLSKKLGYKNINSGNIYRAITYVLVKKFPSLDLEDSEVVKFISDLSFDLIGDDIYYQNTNIASFLRTNDVDSYVAMVAERLYIREKVLKLQQKFVSDEKGGIVIEGRDIGTVVLPNAILKVYLNAKPEIRAGRRYKETENTPYADVLSSIILRDFKDKTREHGALIISKDAHVIDTDDMDIDEVVDKVLELFYCKTKQ